MTPERVKVSVILTSYNHGKFLREAIESVLHQTFSGCELIILDDGSTDESWDIIMRYAGPGIRALRNESTGSVAFVRNAIANVAAGEYIAIHHSDDVWEPRKLETQVAFLDEHPHIGAVFSNALIIGEDGEPFRDTTHFYYSIFDQPNRSRHEWLNYFFYHGNALCHPSVLIRRECYAECGLYRDGLAQIADLDMWMRLCLKYDIHVLPEKLVRFRVRSDEMNASGNRPPMRIRGQLERLLLCKNYLAISTPEELVKVFPAAERYFRQEESDLGFGLAMAALEPESPGFTKLFGLTLLFEALNDAARAGKISELYAFGPREFIELTAKYDIFSVELVASLHRVVSDKEQALQSLAAQVAEKEQRAQEYSHRAEQSEQAVQGLTRELQGLTRELAEIRDSDAYAIVRLLWRMRLKVAPHGSRREQLGRRVMRALHGWSSPRRS